MTLAGLQADRLEHLTSALGAAALEPAEELLGAVPEEQKPDDDPGEKAEETHGLLFLPAVDVET